MNSLTLTGNLGRDCETRFLSDGKPVVSFSVGDSQGKDKPAIWWNCSFFGDRGERVAPYLLKGQTVTVVGTVTEREWTDKDGMKRKSMDIRVNDLALQGGKRDSAPTTAPSQNKAPQQRTASQPARSGGDSGFADMEEDIPF